MRLARSAFPQAAAYSRILSQKCLFSHLWVSVVAFEPKQRERRWKEEGLKDWRGNAKLFPKVTSGGGFFFVVVVLFLIMCWHDDKITNVRSELYLVILCMWLFCLFLFGGCRCLSKMEVHMGYPAKTLISPRFVPPTVLSSFLFSEFCKQLLKKSSASTLVLFTFVPVHILQAYLILEYFALNSGVFLFSHMLQLWRQAGLCCGRNILHIFLFVCLFNIWGNASSQIFNLFPLFFYAYHELAHPDA